MPTRESRGIWKGTLKNGSGVMHIGKQGFEVDYSFPSRFENGTGTNPEELIGASHAGCFSMALSLMIEEAGFTPEAIDTRAEVHLDKTDSGFAITRIALSTTGRVPGMTADAFQQQAEKAKSSCPVSRALAGVDISLQATLDNGGG